MASTGSKKRYINYDLQNKYKYTNVPEASSSTEFAQFGQVETLLTAKQDTVTTGNGIEKSGAELAVSLVQPTEYTLTISNESSYVNGNYVLLTETGYITSSGYTVTFHTGSPDANTYTVWWSADLKAIVVQGASSSWWAYDVEDVAESQSFITAANNDTLTDGLTFDFADTNHYELITSSTENHTNGHKRPADSHASVDYTAGASSYLEFSASKLKASVATSIATGTTGQLTDAAQVRIAIDDAESRAKVSANNTFVDSAAQLGEGTVQGAIEALKVIADDHGVDIAALTNDSTTHGTDIDALETTTATHTSEISTIETDVSTLQSAMTTAESDIDTLETTTATHTGEIAALQLGAGAFWKAVDYHHHSDAVALPVGWGDGVTDVGTFTIDPTGSNLTIADMDIGDRILVIHDATGVVDNGIFEVIAGNAVIRATDADVSDDFTINKTVNIVNGGSHAGATYAYTGNSSPVLGTDVLPFTFKQGSSVGDDSITEEKLATSVVNTLDAKLDKEYATHDLVADTPYVINHSHGICSVTIIDASGNDITAQLEIDHNVPTFDTVTIQSGDSLTGVYVLLQG